MTVSAPAVRMLVVSVAVPDDGIGDDAWPHVYDVVSIETTLAREASTRLAPGGHHRPTTVAEARRMGWEIGPVEVTHDPLVVDDDHGLVPLSVLNDAFNVVFRVVTAPWDRSEDGERLAPVVTELTVGAWDKVRRANLRALASPAARPEAARQPLTRPA